MMLLFNADYWLRTQTPLDPTEIVSDSSVRKILVKLAS